MYEDKPVSFDPKELLSVSPEGQLCAAKFSPCGKFLLAGGFDGLVHRWQVEGEKPEEWASLKGLGGWVSAQACDSKGKWMFAGDSWGQLMCWAYDEAEPEPRWKKADAHNGWILSAAVSPDSTLLATSSLDRRVCLWSTEDGKPHRTLEGHKHTVFAVAFHPSGQWLVSGDLFGVIKQWDANTGECVRELDAKKLYAEHRLQDVGGVRCFSFDAEGKTLAVGGTQPSNGGNVQGIPTVLLFDWESGKEQRLLAMGSTGNVYVHDLHLHTSGVVLAVTSGNPGNGQILFQRPAEDKPLYLSTKLSNCHSLSLHPDGQRLAVLATNKGSNGNGRRVDKDGKYANNTSPVHFFSLPESLTNPSA